MTSLDRLAQQIVDLRDAQTSSRTPQLIHSSVTVDGEERGIVETVRETVALRVDMTEARANLAAAQLELAGIPAALATAKQEAIDASALTAQEKADLAEAAALSAAAIDAAAKASAAEAAAIAAAATAAQTKADAAEAAAITAAATAAQSKADAAQAAAIAAAATDAQTKADAAEAAAAADATAKADAAEAAALAAAATDAQSKADAAQAAAIEASLPKTAGSVTATYIADDAVTTPKLAANSVVAGKIATDAVLANHIKAGEIATAHLAAGSVSTEKLVAGSVITDKIATNAITSDKITSNAITADKIAANAISADKLSANAIDGMTITGAIIRNAASGRRAVLSSVSNKDQLAFYADSEDLVGFVRGSTLPMSGGPTGDTYGVEVVGPLRAYQPGSPSSPWLQPLLRVGAAYDDYDERERVKAQMGIVQAASQAEALTATGVSGITVQTIDGGAGMSEVIINGHVLSITSPGRVTIYGQTVMTHPQNCAQVKTFGNYTSTGSASSAPYPPGGYLTFEAPQSGAVKVTVSARIMAGTDNTHTYLGARVATGTTPGGTVVSTHSDHGRLATYSNRRITASHTGIVTGLSPGADYCVDLLYGAGGSGAVFEDSPRLILEPLLGFASA